MRKTEIKSELSMLAFDFFYWFSRFEFALKENGYLRSHDPGRLAEPGWREFVQRWEGCYVCSRDAEVLLTLKPQIQVVAEADSLVWVPQKFLANTSQLNKVVSTLKTVRNNLFHGGKHGLEDWDDPARMTELVRHASAVLTELAGLAGIAADYSRYY